MHWKDLTELGNVGREEERIRKVEVEGGEMSVERYWRDGKYCVSFCEHIQCLWGAMYSGGFREA